MSKTIYDCAIIGGGIAGLTLSIQLASSGFSVILFEKEAYPFHKVCGEYISMESYNFLERIGVPLSEMNLPMIDELKISSPNGNYLHQKLDLGGFGLSRYSLDSKLSQIAKNKGVLVFDKIKVQESSFKDDLFYINTSKETFISKVACGAYGKLSNLEKTREKNIKNYVGVKYHIKANINKNSIELHNFKNGYCGMSQVENNIVCLCYLTDSQNLRESKNNIKAMEETVLMKNPYLKEIFSNATFLYEQPLTISQITFNKKRAINNHFIQLGDAAGTIAPLCGNGMSMAMHASFLANQFIQKYLTDSKLFSRQSLEKSYTHAWDKQFSTRIKIGKIIQGLFGKEMLTNLTIAILKKMPYLTRQLIKLTHGKSF